MPSSSRWTVLFITLAIPGLAAGANPAPGDTSARVEFFEEKVRPILAGHCYACHSADTKPAGGLRVDGLNGLIAGGNKGPAVVPGKPEESLLLKRVTQEGNAGCRWKGNTSRPKRSPS